MTMPKFTFCKHGKADGEWRYSRATVLSNNNVKRHSATPSFTSSARREPAGDTALASC